MENNENVLEKVLLRYKNILQRKSDKLRIPKMISDTIEKIKNKKEKPSFFTTDPKKGGLARLYQRLDLVDAIITRWEEVDLNTKRLPPKDETIRSHPAFLIWNNISKFNSYLEKDKSEIEEGNKTKKRYLADIDKKLKAIQTQFSVYFEKITPKKKEEEKKEEVVYDCKKHNTQVRTKATTFEIIFKYKLVGISDDGSQFEFDDLLFDSGHEAIIHGKKSHPQCSFYADPVIWSK